MKISGVYFIRNNVNGKVYVGSSIDIYRRWTTHKRELACGRHHSIKLQNSFVKHGQESFSYLLAQSSVCTKEMALLEAKWISFFDSVTNGYNINPFPYEIGLMPKSDEHKRKIGQAHIGRKLSDESKNKIRQSQLGKKDGPMSEEQKKKISEAKLGKKTMSDEGKKRLSEYRKSCKGKRLMSEETKKKIAASKLGKKLGPYKKSLNS